VLVTQSWQAALRLPGNILPALLSAAAILVHATEVVGPPARLLLDACFCDAVVAAAEQLWQASPAVAVASVLLTWLAVCRRCGFFLFFFLSHKSNTPS
jgi:hypothetical protein